MAYVQTSVGTTPLADWWGKLYVSRANSECIHKKWIVFLTGFFTAILLKM